MNPIIPVTALCFAPDRVRRATLNELRNRGGLAAVVVSTGTKGRLDRVQREHGVTIRLAVDAMVSMSGFQCDLPEAQPVDPMIPWMVTVAKTELDSLRKDPEQQAICELMTRGPRLHTPSKIKSRTGDVSVEGLFWASSLIQRLAHVDDELTMDGDAIHEVVDWAREVGPGALEGLGFAGAFEASRAYWRQQSALVEDADIRPGLVLYRWADGATLQRLYTRKQLEAEGHVMRNCVGAKWQWDDVREGEKIILSYRDHEGVPRVDLSLGLLNEYDDEFMLTEANGPDNAGVPYELCRRIIPALQEAGIDKSDAVPGIWSPVIVRRSKLDPSVYEAVKVEMIELGEIEDKVRELQEARDYEGDPSDEEDRLLSAWQDKAEQAALVAHEEVKSTLSAMVRSSDGRADVYRNTGLEMDNIWLSMEVQLGIETLNIELEVWPEDMVFEWTVVKHKHNDEDSYISRGTGQTIALRQLSDNVFGTGHMVVVEDGQELPAWATVEIPAGEWLVDPGTMTVNQEELMEPNS